MFKPEVYKQRRESLKKDLKKGMYLFLGNNETPMNYPDNTYHFRQDSNFLYFFGLNLAGMAAIIDIDNDKDIIFANDVDIDDIIWMGPQPSVKELASKCLINETYEFAKLSDYLGEAINKGRKIHYLPPYKHDNKILINSLLGINFQEMKAKSSLDFIKAVVKLRNVKEDIEIQEIDKACDIGYKMHTTAMKLAKPGISEREIAGIVEGVSLSYGSIPSFPIILTKNGQTLHNHSHDNIFQKGDLMLHDAGAQTTMFYASDNTRTTPIGGKFSQKQKEIYQIVLNTINGSIKLMKPEITYLDIHLKACEILATGLKELGLMKGDINEAVALGAHALFMPHGLGHMMGLDVHDMEDLGQINVGYDEKIQPSKIFGTAFLRMGRELKQGFVLTNEPGIYFIPELIELWSKDKKFEQFINYNKLKDYMAFGGIRLEDDILITENGNRILGSKRIPISIEEVENIMI